MEITGSKGPLVDKELVTKLSEDMIAEDFASTADYFEAHGVGPPIINWSPQLDQLEEPALRTLLSYWNELPKGVRLPLSQKIDPLNMRAALGYVMLLEVLDDGMDYRYRLYGSIIAGHAGFDATGLLVSEIPISQMVPFFLACYQACLMRKEHLFTRHVPPMEVRVRSWDRLILPLENGDGAIDRLLVGNIPGSWRP